MPLPRRTMRQRYFRAKSNIRLFLNFAPVRIGIRVVTLVVVVLLAAKLQGCPVEKLPLELGHKFRGALQG